MGIDKASACRWLEAHNDYAFSLSHAVALGDSPHTNDAPLSCFMDEGMPFVSVCPKDSLVPPHLRRLHIGGCESGTALFIEALHDAIIQGSFTMLADVTGVVDGVRSKT